MSQLFSQTADRALRVGVVCFLLLIVIVIASLLVLVRSPDFTGETVTVQQPIPFSHHHHVSDAGIDCRYCHQSVETSAVAGIPSTQVCMNCHRELWKDSDVLQPVRVSYERDEPLTWNRVNDLPDYVYFDHSIHISKGIGCYSCHGDVSRMPLLLQARSLTMMWCLDCHRNPEAHVRPKSLIYHTEPLQDLIGKPEFQTAVDDQLPQAPAPEADRLQQLRRSLAADYHLHSKTDCYTCHR